jgi:hypothetical protein
MAHQRIAADDRQMQGLFAVDDLQDFVDQFLAFEIAELPQIGTAAQMSVVICVTTRAAQRTLASYLNRERGRLSLEDAAPGLDDFGFLQKSLP